MLYPLKQLLSDGLNLLSANLFALENEDGLDGKEGDGAACAVLRNTQHRATRNTQHRATQLPRVAKNHVDIAEADPSAPV